MLENFHILDFYRDSYTIYYQAFHTLENGHILEFFHVLENFHILENFLILSNLQYVSLNVFLKSITIRMINYQV